MTGADILFIKLELYCMLSSKKINTWHLYITQMETKWTKRYAMTSHVIAYRLAELLFGTHTFNFNCYFDDFNCVFTQIRCLSRLLHFNTDNSAQNDWIDIVGPCYTDLDITANKNNSKTNMACKKNPESISLLFFGLSSILRSFQNCRSFW